MSDDILTAEQRQAIEPVMEAAEGWAVAVFMDLRGQEPDARAAYDRLAITVALALAEARAGMRCYRTWASGLGPNEADADDARMAEFCTKAGYRPCPAHTAAAECTRLREALRE